MAKLRKPFKGTATMKDDGIISKNNKNSINMVNSKGGVSKPKQKKHGLKLPDNFKENIKQKTKTQLLEAEYISKTSLEKLKKLKKDKNLPVEQVKEYQNGSGKDNNQKSMKGNEVQESVDIDFLKKGNKETKLLNKKVKEIVGKKKSNKKLDRQKSTPEPPEGKKATDISEKSEKPKSSKGLKKNRVVKEPMTQLGKLGQSSEKKGKTKSKKDNTETKSKKKSKYLPDSSARLEDILPPFDEEKFFEIVKKENVIELIKGLKMMVQEEISKKKNQVFTDYRYMLNVTCFKIPLCPKRIVKLKVKHSFVTEDDDVCIIVRDLQRGRKFDYEPTIQHYEDLFREKGVHGVKTIIPFNQLKKEYGTYEMKIKLSNLYDYYLCDGAIAGHVSGFLGKNFQKTKCTVHAVRMDTQNTAREIQKALCKTSYKQGAQGTLITIPVGTHKMTPDQVADNILTVISQLKTMYPGGLPNIRHLYAKIAIKGTSAIPLYISDSCPPEQTPVVIGPREQRLRNLVTKVNQTLTKFQMTPTGELVEVATEEGQNKKKLNEEDGDKETPVKRKKSSKEGKIKNQPQRKENSSPEKPKTFADNEESRKVIKKKAKTAKIEEINEESTDGEDDEVQDEIQEEVKPEPAPQPEEDDSDSTDSTFTDSTIFDTSFSSGSDSSTEYSDSPDTDDTIGYSDDESDSEPSIKENGIKESDEDNENSDDEDDDDDDDDEDEDGNE